MTDEPPAICVAHLTGGAALATRAVGVCLLAGAALLLIRSLEALPGWLFLGFGGVVAALSGGLLLGLPRRLASVIDAEGVSLAWALGRQRIAWAAVERVLIAPLGSGEVRDPVAVTLRLRSGEEVLYCLLGRYAAADHPAAAPLLASARRAGVPVEDVTAPPAERSERAAAWRRARLKGWR